MIDLHCHVLPGVDDGPPDLAGSLALCRAARAAGTTAIVATPHVSYDYPHVNGALVGERLAELEQEDVGVRLLPGAEIALSRSVDLSDEELAPLHLGGGEYLLVEPPFIASAAGFDVALHALLGRGHRILLAHPERCSAFHTDLDRLRRYAGDGILLSVTAGSLLGRFGRTVKAFTAELLAAGLVHNISSDGHDAGARRPPSLLPEIEEAGLGDQLDLLAATAQAIVYGGEVQPLIPPARRRRWLRRAS